jgi:ABC-type polysaccharide/polyol phosphate export permease
MTGKRLEPSGPPATREDVTATMPTEEEPSVLGAAATLPAPPRTRRARRAHRASARRGARQARPEPSGNGTADSNGYSDIVYVFEAGAATTTPLRPYLRSLWDRRRFMLEQARADLRGNRSSTALGGLWGILEPLLQAAIYYMLFTIIREGSRPTEFLHILVAGIFLFQLALSSITEGGRSIRGAKSLMLNSIFPRALFPITTVCKAVMKFGPVVPVYAAFHFVLQAPVSWSLVLLPVLFAFQVLLMVGLALLVSTLVVFVRDAGNAVQYVGRLLFFTTPVIYPVALIPDGIRAVLSWQPFFALFASYQEILDGRVPEPGLLVQVVLWAVGILVLGTRVFLRHERELAIRL